VDLNVALAVKVKVQRSRIAYLSNPKPIEGQQLPTILAKTLEGRAGVVDFRPEGPPTILYVFSPSCHWCARNLQNLRSVRDALGGRFRFIGLSLSKKDLSAYVARTGLSFPVFTEPSDASSLAYHFSETPETWVISGSGKLKKRWAGAWTGDTQKEIESFLGVALPGLLDDAAAGSGLH
jgi:hypothetical protein